MKNENAEVVSRNGWKWAFRYGICGLVLAASAGWTAYCAISLAELSAMTKGTEFLDMVLKNFLQAQALLGRIEQFESMLIWSSVVTFLLLVGVVLLVVYQLCWKKKLDVAAEKRIQQRKARQEERRIRREQAVAQAQPAPASAPAPEQSAPVPEQPAPIPEQPAPIPEQPALVPEQPTPAPEQPAQRRYFCMQCGGELVGEKNFCHHCGCKIQASS